jgi:hypothetical protein
MTGPTPNFERIVNMTNIALRAFSIGSNQLEVQHGENRFLISYKTPVAVYIKNAGYYRTTTKFSRTTSKHINKWLDGASAGDIPQNVLEDMMGWNV